MLIPQKRKALEKIDFLLRKAVRADIILGFEHIRAKSEAENMERLNYQEISDDSSAFNIYDNELSISYNANMTMVSDISQVDNRRGASKGNKESAIYDDNHSDYLRNYITFQNEETKKLMTNALELGKTDVLQDEFISKMRNREEEVMSVISENFDDVSAYAEHKNSYRDLVDPMNEVYKKQDKNLTRTDYVSKNSKKNEIMIFPRIRGKLGRSSLIDPNTRRQSGPLVEDMPKNVNQNLQTSLIESEIEAEDEDAGFNPKRFSEVMNNSILRKEALDMLSGKQDSNKANSDVLASMITHKNTAMLKNGKTYTKELFETNEIPEEDESVSVSLSQTARNEFSQRFVESRRKNQVAPLNDSIDGSKTDVKRSFGNYHANFSNFKLDKGLKSPRDVSDIAVLENSSAFNSRRQIKAKFESMEHEGNIDSLSVSMNEQRNNLKDSHSEVNSIAYRLNKSMETKNDDQTLANSEFKDAIKDSKINYSTNDRIKRPTIQEITKRLTIEGDNNYANKFSIKSSEFEDDPSDIESKRLNSQTRGLGGLGKRATLDREQNRNSLRSNQSDMPDPKMLMQMSKKKIDFTLASDRSIDEEENHPDEKINEDSMESDSDSSFYAQNHIPSNKNNFDHNYDEYMNQGVSINNKSSSAIVEKTNYEANTTIVHKAVSSIKDKEQSMDKEFLVSHYDSVNESDLFVKKKSEKQIMPVKFSFAVPNFGKEMEPTLVEDSNTNIVMAESDVDASQNKRFNSFRSSPQPKMETLKSLNETGDQERFRKLFESEFNDLDDYNYSKPLKIYNDFNTFKNDSLANISVSKDDRNVTSPSRSERKSDHSMSNVGDEPRVRSSTEKSYEIFSFNKHDIANKHNYDTQAFHSPKDVFASNSNRHQLFRNSTDQQLLKNIPSKKRINSKADSAANKLKSSDVEEVDVEEWVRLSQVEVPAIRKDDYSDVSPETQKAKKSHFAEYSSPNTNKLMDVDLKRSESQLFGNFVDQMASNDLFNITESCEFKDSELYYKQSNIDNNSKILEKTDSLKNTIQISNMEGSVNQLGHSLKLSQPQEFINSINFESYGNKKAEPAHQPSRYYKNLEWIKDGMLKLEKLIDERQKKTFHQSFFIISMLKLFQTDSRMNIMFSVLSKLVQLKTRAAYDVIYKYCVEYYKVVYQIQQMAKKLKKRSLITSFKQIKLEKIRKSEKRKIRKSELKIFIATFDHIKRNKIYDCFTKIQFNNRVFSSYMSMAGNRSMIQENKNQSKNVLSNFVYETSEGQKDSLIKIRDMNENGDSDHMDNFERSISPTYKGVKKNTDINLHASNGNFFDYLSRVQSNVIVDQAPISKKRNSMLVSKMTPLKPGFINSYNTIDRRALKHQDSNGSNQNYLNLNEPTRLKRRASNYHSGFMLHSYDNFTNDKDNINGPTRGNHPNKPGRGKGELIMKTLSQIGNQLKKLSSNQIIEEDHVDEYILEKLVDVLELLKKIEDRSNNGYQIERKDIKEVHTTLSLLIENLLVYASDEDEQGSKYAAYLEKLQENMQFMANLDNKNESTNKPVPVTASTQIRLRGLTNIIQSLTDTIAKKETGFSPKHHHHKHSFYKTNDIFDSATIPQNNHLSGQDIYRSEIVFSPYRSASTAQNFLISLNFFVIRKKKSYGKVMYSRIKLKSLEVEKTIKTRKKLQRLVSLLRAAPARELTQWKTRRLTVINSLLDRLKVSYKGSLKKSFYKLAEVNSKQGMKIIPRNSLRSLIEAQNISLSSLRDIESLRKSGSNINIDADRPNKLRKSINNSQANMVVKNLEEDFFYLNLEENYMQKVCTNKSLNMSLNKSLSKLGNL